MAVPIRNRLPESFRDRHRKEGQAGSAGGSQRLLEVPEGIMFEPPPAPEPQQEQESIRGRLPDSFSEVYRQRRKTRAQAADAPEAGQAPRVRELDREAPMVPLAGRTRDLQAEDIKGFGRKIGDAAAKAGRSIQDWYEGLPEFYKDPRERQRERREAAEKRARSGETEAGGISDEYVRQIYPDDPKMQDVAREYIRMNEFLSATDTPGEDGGRLPEMIKGVVYGLGSGAAQLPRGIAMQYKNIEHDLAEGLDSPLEDVVDAETRKKIPVALGGDPSGSVEDKPLYKAGKSMQDWLDKNLAPSAEYIDDPFVETSMAFGSFAWMMLLSALGSKGIGALRGAKAARGPGRLIPGSAKLINLFKRSGQSRLTKLTQQATQARADQFGIAATTAAASGTTEVYDTAKQVVQENPDISLTEKEVLRLSRPYGTVGGVVQVAPLGVIMRPLANREVRRTAMSYLVRRMLEAGLSEFTVENAGGVLFNSARRTYDEDHSLWENIPERGEPAGYASALMQALLFPWQRRGMMVTPGKPSTGEGSPFQEDGGGPDLSGLSEKDLLEGIAALEQAIKTEDAEANERAHASLAQMLNEAQRREILDKVINLPVEGEFAEAARRERAERPGGFGEFVRRTEGRDPDAPMETPGQGHGLEAGPPPENTAGHQPMETPGQNVSARPDVPAGDPAAAPAGEGAPDAAAGTQAPAMLPREVHNQALRRFFSDLRANDAGYVGRHRLSVIPQGETDNQFSVAITHPTGETEIITPPKPAAEARADAMVEADRLLQERMQLPSPDPEATPPAVTPTRVPEDMPQRLAPRVDQRIWDASSTEAMEQLWAEGLAHADSVEAENQAMIKDLEAQLADLRGMKGKGFARARRQILEARERLLSEPDMVREIYARQVQYRQAVLSGAAGADRDAPIGMPPQGVPGPAASPPDASGAAASPQGAPESAAPVQGAPVSVAASGEPAAVAPSEGEPVSSAKTEDLEGQRGEPQAPGEIVDTAPTEGVAPQTPDTAASTPKPSLVERIDTAANERQRSNFFIEAGQEAVPGIRLGDAEEAGRMAYLLEKGEIAQADFDSWVEQARRENRIRSQRPAPEEQARDQWTEPVTGTQAEEMARVRNGLEAAGVNFQFFKMDIPGAEGVVFIQNRDNDNVGMIRPDGSTAPATREIMDRLRPHMWEGRITPIENLADREARKRAEAARREQEAAKDPDAAQKARNGVYVNPSIPSLPAFRFEDGKWFRHDGTKDGNWIPHTQKKGLPSAQELTDALERGALERRAGVPAPEGGAAAAEIEGKAVVGSRDTTFLPDDTGLEVEYGLVEAEDLNASHTENMEKNPDFPPELQPRDRLRDAMKLQVTRMANKLNPFRLGRSAGVSSGAPIVADDMVVESGNGRIIAIKMAYQQEKGDEYRQWLKDHAGEFGLDSSAVESFKRPVLVRIRRTEVDDRADFARKANQEDVAAMGPAETAQADAERITDGMLDLFRPSEDGNIATASNKDFINRFLESLGANESAGLVTADGRYTKQLVDRIRAALFAKAYNNDHLITLMAEEADPGVKNLLNALTIAAPRFAKARSANSEVYDKAQLAEYITGALSLRQEAAAEGFSLDDYLKQTRLFGDEIPELTRELAGFIENNKRSAKRMGEVFRLVARDLHQKILDQKNMALPGMQIDDISIESIVSDAIENIRRFYDKDAQVELFRDQRDVQEGRGAGQYPGRGRAAPGVAGSGEGFRTGAGEAAYGRSDAAEAKVEEPRHVEGTVLTKSSPGETVRFEQAELPFGRKSNVSGREVYREESPGYVHATTRTVTMRTTGDVRAEGNVVRDVADAAALADNLGLDPQENILTIATDADGVVLEIHEYARGGKASATANVTEIAGPVLDLADARHLYFVHNHPSQFVNPSSNDRNLHTHLKEILSLKDVDVHSLVVGGDAYQAFGTGGAYGERIAVRDSIRKSTKLPVRRRAFSSTQAPSDVTLKNPAQADTYLETAYNNADGFLFIGMQGEPLGFLPFSPGMEASKMAREVLRTANYLNAGRVIVNSGKDATTGKRHDFYRSLFPLLSDVNVLDVLSQGESLMEKGALNRVFPERDVHGATAELKSQGPVYHHKPRGNVAPVWHSGLVRGVDGMDFKTMPAGDLLARLKKIPGVKQEELDWTGLESWLTEQGKRKVTRQEVMDFLAANNLELQEVTKTQGEGPDSSLFETFQAEDADGIEHTRIQWSDLEAIVADSYDGGATFDIIHKNGDLLATAHSEAEARQILKREIEEDFPHLLSRKEVSDTVYQQYQLPGGENYREMLLILPQSDVADMTFAEWAVKTGRAKTENAADDLFRSRGSEYQEFQRLQANIGKSEYRSPHWDESNIVAHVRFNEHKITDPKQIDRLADQGAIDSDFAKTLHSRLNEKGRLDLLLVEEDQSEWHQAGRKKGYHGKDAHDLNFADWIRQKKQFDWSKDKIDAEFKKANESPMYREWRATSSIQGDTVPDAPFKTTWPMLVMKRMVRYAAENGFDLVAWTPGEVQADRYDLSKQVSLIEAFPMKPDGGVSMAMMLGEDPVNNVTITTDPGGTLTYSNRTEFRGKPLSDVVGKEMADKIMAVEKHTTFEGADLKVGGHGMKAFYDRMLPNEVNKFFGKKKWGKPKVEAVEIGTGETVFREGVNTKEEVLDMAAGDDMLVGDAEKIDSLTENDLREGLYIAKDLEGKWNLFEGKKVNVHALPITDQIREKALAEGMPMFVRAKAEDAASRAQAPGLERTLRQITHEALPGLEGRVAVMQSEVNLPRDLRRAIVKDGMSGSFDGIYWRGRVWFVADNLTSVEAAQEAYLEWLLRHEGRHMAMDDIFEGHEARRKFFSEAAGHYRDEVSAYMAERGMADTADNRAVAAEEVLVDQVRQGKTGRFIDEFIAKVMRWLRKLFPDMRLSEAEVRNVIARADSIIDAPGDGVYIGTEAYGAAPQYLFAGESAYAPNAGLLGEARRMKNAGRSRAQVWRDTGWWEITPGQWRFEIDDSKVALRRKGKKGARFTDIVRSMANEGTPLKLGNLIDAPDLFDAYPFLQDIGFSRSALSGEGGYNANLKMIFVNEDLPAGKVKSLLLHEIQHAIQGHEGFAQGGNLSVGAVLAHGFTTRDEYMAALEQLQEQQKEAGKKLAEETAAEPYEGQQAEIDELTRQVHDIQNEIRHLKTMPPEAMEHYQRLTGEAESRLVQRREEMTPAQRREQPPWKTLGKMLADEGQIEPGQNPEDVLYNRYGATLAMATSGELEAMGWRPEDVYKTQISATRATYDKVASLLNESGITNNILDYGAGKGIGARTLGAWTFEPYPDGWRPDFVHPRDINRQYDAVTCCYVLNVVPDDIRAQIVSHIKELLRPGGKAVILTRGRDVMDAKAGREIGEKEVFTSRGTYQRGFSPDELQTYVQRIMGGNFSVEKIRVGSAPAAVVATRKVLSGEEAAAVTPQQVLPADFSKKAPSLKRGGKVAGRNFVIGKVIGGQVYLHRNHAEAQIGDPYSRAKKIFDAQGVDWDFTTVRYNPKTGDVRFEETRDFDWAREPSPGRTLTVAPDGSVKKSTVRQVYHHKWLWVDEQYQGFDVEESRQWSDIYRAAGVTRPSGWAHRFEAQLAEAGVPGDATGQVAAEGEVRYHRKQKDPGDVPPAGEGAHTMRDINGKLHVYNFESGRWEPAGERPLSEMLADVLKDERYNPHHESASQMQWEKLKKLDPRIGYQKYIGDPLWKALSETMPEAAGRRLEIVDKFNKGFITDYRKDSEYIKLREDTQYKIRQAQRIASELSRTMAKFPRAEQVRIGQIVEGSITVTPKRYETALQAAEKFRELEAELQEVGLLGPDNRFRQLTRREIDSKFQEIAAIEQEIAKKEAQLSPQEKVVRQRSRRVSEAVSESVSESVIDNLAQGDDPIEVRISRAVQLNEERVRDALLHRGFARGEADQMIERIKQSVIAPEKTAADPKTATEVKKVVERVIERTVTDEIVKRRVWDKGLVKRGKTSILKEINKLNDKRADILYRIQTHYKMSGKKYLRMAYDTVEDNKKFLKNLRQTFARPRLKKGYDKRRKDLDKKWKMEHRLATPRLVLKGISEEAYDAHMMRMFIKIADNPKWAVPAEDQYIYAARDERYTKFKPLPASDKLGPLSGMMVDPYIYDDINQVFALRSQAGKVYDELLALWKTGKVVYNPAAQARNIMSGAIMAYMGDLTPARVDLYARAAKELKENSEVLKYLLDRGVMGRGADWAGQEIMPFLDEVESLNIKHGNFIQQSSFLIRKLAQLPGRSYQGIEQLFKVALFLKAREQGKSWAQAAQHAEDYGFNYSKIPPGIRWAKRWYSPFITWSFKAIPKMVEISVRKPWKMAVMYTLFRQLEEASRRMFGESEEELEREKRVLPDYMRREVMPGFGAFPGVMSHIRVPVTDQYNRSKYLDLSFILPWGDIGMDWGQSRINLVPQAFLPSHPMYIVPAEITMDEILFTGQDLSKEWMDNGEYAKAIGKEIWRQLMPTLAGSYSYNKLMAAIRGERDWAGRERSLTEAIFDVFFGLRLRTIDYNEELYWRLSEQQDALRDLERHFKRDYRQIHIQAPSDDPQKQRKRERELWETYTQRVDRILDEIRDIKDPTATD